MYNASMDELYQLIKKKKLASAKEVSDFCENGKPSDILETVLEALVITNTSKNFSVPGSLFNFSASTTLSGGAYPCVSQPCRIRQVKDLARFSSIYSDCTIIHNPFDFAYCYIDPSNHIEQPVEKIRTEALNAFLIALDFQPLIERGLIKFSKTIYAVCANCKKENKKTGDATFSDLNKIAESALFPLIKNRVKLEYEKKSFHLSGIEALIGEDMFIHYKKFPDYLIKNGRKIDSLEKIKFSNPLMQKIMGEAINSVMVQKIDNPGNLAWTYLTNNMLEKTLLEKMGKQSENKALNLFVEGLPVVQGKPYESILKIRDSYADEFKSFQDHVSSLVKKADSFGTQEEFNTYVGAKLKEQLQDLKKIQKGDNLKLMSKGFLGGLFLGATISISVVSNSDLASFINAAQAFYGCSSVLFEATEMAKKMQQSPLYFYYQLEKLKE
jgi:hypothetical protein